MTKNELFELTITGMTLEGQGVGRVAETSASDAPDCLCAEAPDETSARGGMAVFVPGAAVGDRLRVRIVKVLRSYAFGKIEEILAPSPARTEPDCPVYRQCGGCVYRHVTREEELRVKLGQVRDCLARLGGLDVEVEGILTGGRADGYRNKAQYPLGIVDGRVAAGFFAPHSHRIVPNSDCPLSPPVFGRVVNAVTDFLTRYQIPVYDETTHTGLARHLYLRLAEATGQLMVCLVVNGERIPRAQAFVAAVREAAPETVSVLLSVNRADTNVVLGRRFVTLWGGELLEDELCGVRVRLAPAAFYQVNHDAAELLYTKAAEFASLRPDDVLLDLYCGAGTIGLSMASQVAKVIGVDNVSSAIDNASDNARLNDIRNAVFRCADASEAAAALAEEGVRPTVVVLDPPRKGCDAALLDTVASLAPERVVYVSCNPATLARDCKRLGELGYATRRAVAVDLFPRTGHVETVVLMTRTGTRNG